MMRRPLIAGNWKMNLDRTTGTALALDVVAGCAGRAGVDVVLCPPFVYLEAVGSTLRGSAIGLGAQDLYHEASGAFTGEVSAAMLLDVGCQWVIIGHSERRQLLGETNGSVLAKVRAALAAERNGHTLTPIVCVGETLAERETGRTQEVIRSQFAESLAELSEGEFARVVLAYEPVWAIGTGRVATPDQAGEVHADLRKQVADRYNAAVASEARILYGGSVKPENAGQLFAQPNIDGALVGGASLKAADFLGIIAATA
ncbi:MAG: triose-phosphate isomerase [Pirellulales bacterium]|nr:triose-phosphate isomerase [Pirellulales bacterium]